MTATAYAAPTIELTAPVTDNEVPWAAAAAAVLPVGAAFVAWVCLQCPNQCRSLPQTIDTVRKWLDGTGC